MDIGEIIVGVVVGVAAATVTPWAQYGVDTRRSRRERRRAVIDRGRSLLAEWNQDWAEIQHRLGHLAADREFLADDVRFLDVRPHLSPDALAIITDPSSPKDKTPFRSVGAGATPATEALARDLDRLEQKWKLV